MSTLILTRREVHELTGYERPSKQIEKLKEYGVRFIVAADGYPRVLRVELQPQNQPRREPNFRALKKAG